jgi:glycosyltransferase involved in cell wall biosynthesis
MDRGGVETWLMEVFRHVDRTRFAMDVLVHSSRPGAYDDEARRLGVSIIPAVPGSQPGRFARRFLEVLGNGPGYDVLHSHVHHYSAYTLGLARYAGVPVRIAHSHSDTAEFERSARIARRAYFASTRQILRYVATDRIGVSTVAGRALFGPEWPSEKRDRILHIGYDFSRFDEDLDSADIRRTLGIPPDAFVIGHVGRFVDCKNHAFIVEMMAEVARRDPRAMLLLVGDGPLRQDIDGLVASRGLSDRVVFAGARGDVPDVMRAAMDVFILPSLREGLPIVGLEAQAAGLPCLFSDIVSREVSAVPQLTRFLSLRDSPQAWAGAVLDTRNRATSRKSMARDLMASSFNIDNSLESLLQIYTRRPSVPRTRTAV